MNEPNEPNQRERLLAQLLAGEIRITDGDVQRAMRDDPEFAEEAEALLALGDELSVGAPVEVGTEEPWPGADRAVADLVTKELGADGVAPQSRPARSWPMWAAIAATALIAVLIWKPWDTQDVVDPGQTLGPAKGEMWPDGEVTFDEFVRRGFQWNLDVPDDVAVQLEIEVDDEPFGEPIRVTGVQQLAVPEALRVRNPTSLFWVISWQPAGRGATTWSRDVTFR